MCYPFFQDSACSEGLMDSDCAMGTCSLDPQAGYAVCTDGSAGVSCDSSRGCMGGLVCATVFVTGGGNSIDHCSECGERAPCAGDGLCTLVLEGGIFGAYLGCVAPGSVELGGTCPLDDMGVGDGTACVSGQCAATEGGFALGICSECDADDDCTPPMTCSTATFMMGMAEPAVCQ
jgi:hypothetical protein